MIGSSLCYLLNVQSTPFGACLQDFAARHCVAQSPGDSFELHIMSQYNMSWPYSMGTPRQIPSWGKSEKYEIWRYTAQWSRCQLGCSGSQNLPCTNYKRIICSCSNYLKYMENADCQSILVDSGNIVHWIAIFLHHSKMHLIAMGCCAMRIVVDNNWLQCIFIILL